VQILTQNAPETISQLGSTRTRWAVTQRFVGSLAEFERLHASEQHVEIRLG